MAINAYGENAALASSTATTSTASTEDKSVLGKDDFMTLLLVELQNQDPTEPMDSENILTQTSQLASIEAAENTNKALEDLATSLNSSQEFSTVAAIGKRADLGSDAISHDQGSTSSFEMYFPEDIKAGTVTITDMEGNAVSTINIDMEDANGNAVEQRDAGVYQFDWDGKDANGNYADSAVYRINAQYTTPTGDQLTTRVGAYPIESVRFDGGETYLKLGSSYVPLSDVVEIY